MERDTLSFSQLMMLLFGGLMGPAAELLPGTAAKAGAAGALGVTGAVVLMLVAGLFVRSLAAEEGFAVGLTQVFGRWGGKVVLTIYMVWGELLLAVRLRQSAQRLSECGERDGAVWFFVLVLAGMTLWMAYGHLGALGRAAQLFFGALAVVGGMVLIFSLHQVRSGRLLVEWPWSRKGIGAVLLPGAQVLGYGVFASFLYECSEKRRTKRWIRCLCVVWLVLVVVQIIVVGRFGPRVTLELNSGFFQLAEGIGLEGAFQRVESLVAAVWVFSDLLLLAGILWGMRRIGEVLWPEIPASVVIASAGGLSGVAAVAVLGVSVPVWNLEWYVVPIGNLVLGAAIPGAAYFWKRKKKNVLTNGE